MLTIFLLVKRWQETGQEDLINLTFERVSHIAERRAIARAR